VPKSVQVLEDDGGAAPTATGRRPKQDYYIRVPQLLKQHFEANGRNLIPDANRPEYLAMKAAQGQEIVFLSELPTKLKDELVKDARRAGWIPKKDEDILVFGDMVLCSQSEEERAFHADEAAALWAMQADDASLVESLNDGARQHLSEMLGGPLAGSGHASARAETLTGGGAASHIAGGRAMRQLYGDGKEF
jgi:hypothetical protein